MLAELNCIQVSFFSCSQQWKKKKIRLSYQYFFTIYDLHSLFAILITFQKNMLGKAVPISSSQIFMYNGPGIFQMHIYVKTLFPYMNGI